MFGKPSLMTSIAVGKTAGLVFGGADFFLLPWFWPEAGMMLRWGVLLWYITLGGIIGLFGVFNRHPVLRMNLPWWFRGPFIGGWMNFLLALIAHDKLAAMMSASFGAGSALASPFWLVAEGMVIGLIIAYLAFRFGGEGPETAGK